MSKYYVEINGDGDGEFWYKDPNLQIAHRVFGPSSAYSTGYVRWCRDDDFHRVGGPAITYSDGRSTYWLNGKFYEKDEYDEILHVDRNKR